MKPAILVGCAWCFIWNYIMKKQENQLETQEKEIEKPKTTKNNNKK